MERVRELDRAGTAARSASSEDEFRRLMHEETIVVEFEPEHAKRSLPRLVRTAADRRHAHELLDAMRARIPSWTSASGALAAELQALLPLPPADAARMTARRDGHARCRRATRRPASAARRGARLTASLASASISMRDFTNRTFDEIAVGATRNVSRR